MRRFCGMTCVWVLLAALAAGPAWAQEPGDPKQSEEEKESEAPRYEDEITVTGADAPTLTVESCCRTACP